jgi:hypothetical protein
MKKICTQCKKEFEAIRRGTKYCSQECFQKATQYKIQQSVEERILIKMTVDEPIVIVPLADVHNNWDYLQWAVDEIQKHPNWYVVINGDLWDADQYSSHPTTKVTPLSNSVQTALGILLPIADRILGFVWGNHEERCFRAASGKGTMPSYFDVFFQAIKAKNPLFQYADPMQSLILELKVKGKLWKILFKHGRSAGKTFGMMEYRDILTVNTDINIVVLSHLHLPLWMPVSLWQNIPIEEVEYLSRLGEKDGIVHLVRTTAGVATQAYQDEMNLFKSPTGLTKLFFNGDFRVEPR